MSQSQINKSYFYDLDTKYGWGNVSYFTFFSEFNRSSRKMAGVECVSLSLIFIVAILGNTNLIISLCNFKKPLTATQYYLSNLAGADLLFVVSCPVIASIRLMETWRLGEITCNLLTYVMFVCAFTIIWTMAAISVDRYICICTSRPRSPHSQRNVFVICLIIWIVSFTLFSPVACFFFVKEIQTGNCTITFCTLVWPKTSAHISIIFTLALCFLALFSPLTIISVNYYRIFRKLQATHRAVRNVTVRQTAHSSRINIKTNRNTRVVKIMLLIVSLFVVMSLPLFITFGLVCYDVSFGKNMIPSHVLVWMIALSYLNACVNPFLYGVVNRTFELCICCRQQCCKGINFRELPRQRAQRNSVCVLQPWE